MIVRTSSGPTARQAASTSNSAGSDGARSSSANAMVPSASSMQTTCSTAPAPREITAWMRSRNCASQTTIRLPAFEKTCSIWSSANVL